jgi:hypothetical protein
MKSPELLSGMLARVLSTRQGAEIPPFAFGH